ncbi:hypothetical protein NLJ89_g9608 [Agrocybe chaxingu]|uniref:DUF6535 domain-containing protein n=1 Tax=Agrocybe chaxingu TaxID=84603 RepID=A0A9W8MSY0_9AGAR|nr:hypothetical protein NLJ89_g9608 [Agrocybe chaxingu]
MSQQVDHEGEDDPKLWKCGDPYQYTIPKPEGNPWEVVLDALMKKDKVQCDAWKDEVQNLLIFNGLTTRQAGLFSAVVTAFVVESCKSLHPDSSDASVVLLALIAERLDGNSTSISLSPKLPQALEAFSLDLTPSSSTVRVNTFWFLSLVLSLTTVLIGIVSLQWLREHQRYSETLTPRQALCDFPHACGRFRGLACGRKYSHPCRLLLQIALILFFAGIIDFLLSLSVQICILVSIVLGPAVIFILLTTVLPALQCFAISLRIPSSSAAVPSPCPYKSPQALIFRRLLTMSRRLFDLMHSASMSTKYYLLFFDKSFLFAHRSLKIAAWRHRLFPDRAYLFWAQRTWVDFDRTWLILRNEHFDITRKRSSGDPSAHSMNNEPVYDSIRGLASAAQGNEHHEDIIFSVYHCFQDLSQSMPAEEGEYPHHHLQACFRDLVPTWNSPIANIASLLESPSFDLLHDIHTVLFLRVPGIFYKAINPAHVLGRHMLELQTRILVYLYADEPRRLVSNTLDSSTGFFHWYTINMASLNMSPETQDAFLQPQFFALFKSFVEKASTLSSPDDVGNTFHTHPDLDDFVSLASFLIWHIADRTPDSQACLTTLSSTLDLIEDILSPPNKSSQADFAVHHADFLFWCATHLLKRLWQERPSQRRSRSANGRSLLQQLARRFDVLQKDVLARYESAHPDTLRIAHSRMLSTLQSPSNYFTHGGRDFRCYAREMGTYCTDEPGDKDDDSLWTGIVLDPAKSPQPDVVSLESETACHPILSYGDALGSVTTALDIDFTDLNPKADDLV